MGMDRFAYASDLLGNKYSKKVGYARTLIRVSDDIIVLRHHNTDVVTYHRDGRMLINMGGYDTVVTKRTIKDWTPGRCYGGCYWGGEMERTPSNVKKCKRCKGVGYYEYTCKPWWYGAETYDIVTREKVKTCEHGKTGEHPDPVKYDCWQCKGAGVYDYGNKPIGHGYLSTWPWWIDNDGTFLGILGRNGEMVQAS